MHCKRCTMGLTCTNISLDDTQVERRRAKSAHDHVPVSESVRRAIDSSLAWNNPTYHPKPPMPRKGRAILPRHEWTGLSGSFSVNVQQRSGVGLATPFPFKQ